MPELAADIADPIAHLLLATARGDRQAFEQLYRHASPRLFAIAMRIARRREMAEDVLQDAFVTIWRKASQFDPSRGSPIAWMATVVRSRAIDRIRAPQAGLRESASYDEAIESGLIAEPSVPAIDPAEIGVRRCLERLQEKPREAIYLAYYFGLTHEELADRLDAPLGTVKSWVRRGLGQLKECLES